MQVRNSIQRISPGGRDLGTCDGHNADRTLTSNINFNVLPQSTRPERKLNSPHKRNAARINLGPTPSQPVRGGSSPLPAQPRAALARRRCHAS
jgi:hypothetical protein